MSHVSAITTNMDDDILCAVEPLFVRTCDFRINKANITLLIYNLVKANINKSVFCVKKFRGVYKIYLEDDVDRISLLICGLPYNGLNITVYEINPYECESTEFISEKIIIKHLPFNISNVQVLEELEGFDNLKIISRVLYSRERDNMNNLTDCRNGDRFVYAKGPIIPPLQKEMKISGEKCVILHKSQKTYCRKCKKVGHTETNFEACPAYIEKDDERVLFKSDKDPLSNFYSCKIHFQNQTFNSSEHAYQWAKASSLGHSDLAESVKEAVLPKDSKKVTEILNSTDLENWETQKMTTMSDILRAKYDSCKEFRQALDNTNDKQLVEATTHPYWGCGLKKSTAIHTNTKYLPGQNILGELLMLLRREKTGTSETIPPEHDENINIS